MASPTAVEGGLSADVGASDRSSMSAIALDARGGVALAQVLEHERGRVDGGQRVGDAFAGDVVGRPVDRLEQRRTGTGRVEVGRGGEADASGTAPARSVRMSPNRLSVTITS